MKFNWQISKVIGISVKKILSHLDKKQGKHVREGGHQNICKDLFENISMQIFRDFAPHCQV